MEKEVVLLNSKGKFGLYLDSGIYELNELFVLISFPFILWSVPIEQLWICVHRQGTVFKVFGQSFYDYFSFWR